MAFFGFIKRKERWSLTATGWIALIAVVAAVLVAAVFTVHPFLAVNEPVQGEILVVEGWLPDYALEGAMQWFRSQRLSIDGYHRWSPVQGALFGGVQNFRGVDCRGFKKLGTG